MLQDWPEQQRELDRWAARVEHQHQTASGGVAGTRGRRGRPRGANRRKWRPRCRPGGRSRAVLAVVTVAGDVRIGVARVDRLPQTREDHYRRSRP